MNLFWDRTLISPFEGSVFVRLQVAWRRSRLGRFQEEHAQRRNAKRQVKRPAGVWLGHSPRASVVADVRTPVAFGIGVEDFAVVTARGNADPIIVTNDQIGRASCR